MLGEGVEEKCREKLLRVVVVKSCRVCRGETPVMYRTDTDLALSGS